MTGKTRKASDILIDLEREVRLILQMQKSQQNAINILLDRTNAFVRALESGQNEMSKEHQTLTAKPVENNFPEQSMSGFVELQTESATAITARRDIRKIAAVDAVAQVAPATEKRKSVQQKIMYPTGGEVILATVNVFSAAGDLIKSTKTNNFGNWIAALFPGEYRVKVTKKAVKDKPPIDLVYNINVPDTTAQAVTFDPPEI